MEEEYHQDNIIQNHSMGLTASAQQPYELMLRKLKSLRDSGNQV